MVRAAHNATKKGVMVGEGYFEIECAAKVMSLMTLSILFNSYNSYVVVHSAWRLVQCSLASDVY